MLHSVKRRYAGSYPHLSSAHARPDGEPIGRGTLVGKYQGSELDHGPTGLRLFTCRSDVRFGSLADISWSYRNVPFYLRKRTLQCYSECLPCANSGHLPSFGETLLSASSVIGSGGGLRSLTPIQVLISSRL